jgi:hypothetical protein
MKQIFRCAFEGCPKTTEQRGLDGWTNFDFDHEHPSLTGWYSPEHARALEAVLVNEDDEDDR